MGVYEQCLRPPLGQRVAALGMRVARAGARRAARVVGAKAIASARALSGAIAPAPSVDACAWVIDAQACVQCDAVQRDAVQPRAVQRDAVQRDAVQPRAVRPRAVQVIGSLAAGGAERQLALFAGESQRLGLADQRVLTLNACEGVHAHYAPMVLDAGIPLVHAGAATTASDEVRRRFAQDEQLRRRLMAIPLALRPYATDLAGEFLASGPDVVQAWLDHANICAGVAALAVGVPRVVLTFRSLNPTHFPAWCQPWMLPWYRVLAADARVRMCANSEAGADDYARWIGIDRARIGVVRNGLDPSVLTSADDARRAALRDELGAAGRPLVVGVFRIGDEKQPLLFADVARRVLAKEPRALFCVAGDGPMRDELARAAAPMGGSFRLLGRRNDAIALLATADVALLTSRVEGTPNVLVEAQAMGTPVVATKVGGIPDAVRDGETGILADSGDAEALSRGVLAIVHDDALRARMSANARAFTHAEFSLERMSRSMCALYA